ncbi:MAG: hypothetical protein WAT91_13240, partial [Saprospiraceae bacterium]
YKNANCLADSSVAVTGSPTAVHDNCTATPAVTHSDVVTQGCTGSYSIARTWHVVDACLNAAFDQVQVITVSDTIKPVVTAGTIAGCYNSVAAAEAAAIAATTAVDNCSAVLKTAVTVTTACDFAIVVTATDACGNSNFVTYTTLNSCQNVRLKVMLEGPYNPSTDIMDNTLNVNHVLPGQDKSLSPSITIQALAPYTPFGQPYSVAPWNFIGNSGSTYGDPSAPGAPSGVTPYPANVVDWVLVTVRHNGILPANNVWSCAGWVYTDGHVTFPDPCGSLVFVPGDQYYILVQHRTHLGVLSPLPANLTCGGMVIDWNFTSGDSYAPLFRYGQKQVEPGVWAMYAANGEQETSIAAISSSDRTKWRTFQNAYGYSIGDFNMSAWTESGDETIWKFNQNKTSGIIFY